MAKRAYSPKDVANIKHKALPLEGEWKDVFGEPEEGDTWFISGPSASGKSSFVMQFAKMLCGIGKCCTCHWKKESACRCSDGWPSLR